MDNKEEKNVNNPQASISIRVTDGNKNHRVQVPDSSPVRVNYFLPFNPPGGAGTGSASYLRPNLAGNGSYKNRHDQQTDFKASMKPPSAADIYQSKYIENIADFLDPAVVRHYLFQGHANEHIAVDYLNPDIDATPQDDDNQNSAGLQPPAPAPFPTGLDTKVCCVFCHQNLLYDAATYQRRSCGHYFHMQCYHAQPPAIQEIDMKIRECNFCVLERP